MRTIVLLLLTLLCAVSSGFSQEMIKRNSNIPILRGSYLGQKQPEMTSEVFALGIISNVLPNRDIAISPDGNEMYFGLHTPDFNYLTIIVTKQIDGVWTTPEVVSFASDPRYDKICPDIDCN